MAHRLPRIVTLAAAALAVAAGSAQAATYYVDGATGTDALAGTTQATAWKTISRVNSVRFVAGDTVLFRGGATYPGMLSPHAVGSAAAPVVFGAYGTGRPVLDGSAGGFAGIEIDYASRFVTFRGLEIRNYSNEAAYLVDGSNITFDDLYAHDNPNGIWVGGSSAGVKNVTISNSRIFASISKGIVVNNSNDQSTGWIYRDSEFANAGDSCILDWPGQSTYERVNVHHCGYDASLTHGKHGIYLKGSGSVIRDSELSDVFMGVGGGSCISPRGGGQLIGNRLHGCPSGIGWFDYTRAASSKLVIRRNAVYGYRDFGIYADKVCSCNVNPYNVANHTVEFDVANNTFAAGTTAGGASQYGVVFAGAETGHTMDVRFDNNIVAGTLDGPALQLFNSRPGTYAGTGNAYFDTSGTSQLLVAGRNYSATALPGEHGSVIADPSFTNATLAAADLSLRSTSALRDRGTATPVTGALQGGCAAIVDAFCGAAPEPGAFELDGAVPPTSPPPATGPTPTAPKQQDKPPRPSHLKVERGARRLSAHWRSNGARSFRVYVDGRLRRTTSTPRLSSVKLVAGRHKISIAAVVGGVESTRTSTVVKFG